jgi:hypothetical protein
MHRFDARNYYYRPIIRQMPSILPEVPTVPVEQYKKGGKVKKTKKGNVTQTVNVYVTKRQSAPRARAPPPRAPIYAQGQPVAYPEPRLPQQLQSIAQSQQDLKLGFLRQQMQMQQLQSRINQPLTPGLPFERQSVPGFAYHNAPHGVSTNFNEERDLELALLRSTASMRRPDYPNGYSDLSHNDLNIAQLMQQAEHGSFTATHDDFNIAQLMRQNENGSFNATVKQGPDEVEVNRTRPNSPGFSEAGPGSNPFFEQLADHPSSIQLPESVPFQPANEPIPQPFPQPAVSRTVPEGTLTWAEWAKGQGYYYRKSQQKTYEEEKQYTADKKIEYNAYLDRRASQYEAERIPGPAPRPLPKTKPLKIVRPRMRDDDGKDSD